MVSLKHQNLIYKFILFENREIMHIWEIHRNDVKKKVTSNANGYIWEMQVISASIFYISTNSLINIYFLL